MGVTTEQDRLTFPFWETERDSELTGPLQRGAMARSKLSKIGYYRPDNTYEPRLSYLKHAVNKESLGWTRRIRQPRQSGLAVAAVQQLCARVNHPADVQIAPGPFRPTLQKSPITFRQSPDPAKVAAGSLNQDPRLALPQIQLRSIPPLPDGSDPLFSAAELANPQLLAARVANPVDEATQWLVERFSQNTISLLKAFDPSQPIKPALVQALDQEMRSLIRVWTPQPDLLESQADDYDYVVEVDDSGIAHLRFGDGNFAPIGLLGHDSVAMASTTRSVSFVELPTNMTGRGCDALIACW